MSDCPCPHHPLGCFGHPHSCNCSERPADSTGPWIEYGTGWAKIHFRREVTDQDSAALLAALSRPQRQES